jgi:thiosulfate dehydrogenase [quinone] large subunit
MDARMIEEARRLPTDRTLARWAIGIVRIVFGMLWLTNVSWKFPPDFRLLRTFTGYAVEYPVLGVYSAVIEHVVLPHFTPFGYAVLVTEASVGAFLLIGLATRLWAVVGMVMTISIALSVLNAPHEWSWTYYMMLSGHALLWATAAGRTLGLDGILRAGWLGSEGRVWQLLGRVS